MQSHFELLINNALRRQGSNDRIKYTLIHNCLHLIASTCYIKMDSINRDFTGLKAKLFEGFDEW